MFTGIVESTAQLIDIQHNETNADMIFTSPLAPEFKIDQSVAHNGVCLTVTGIRDNTYSVTLIEETLKRSNLGNLQIGASVNIERCLAANARFDGHFVQGHVDAKGICKSIRNLHGSWEVVITHASDAGFLTVEKGSICLNGVSLTVVQSDATSFSVHLIPYTWEHTTFSALKVGDSVNLEFDIIGKYISKILSQKK